MLIVYIVLIVLFLILKTQELPSYFILINNYIILDALYYTSVYNPYFVDGSLAKIIRLSKVYHL